MPNKTPPAVTLPWISGVAPIDLPPTVVYVPDEFDVGDVAGAYPHGWVPRPAVEVEASWLRQVTLLEVAGVRVRLQARLGEAALAGVAGNQFADRPAPEWPWAEPLLVIGAVRGPSVVYPGEAAASRDEIVRQLGLFGVAAASAWTVDRGHLWSEPSVIAYPNSDDPKDGWHERVLEIARQMGIGMVVQVAHGLWTVLSLGIPPYDRYSVTVSVPASVTRDVERRCPMRTAPREGAYCQMRGGPWTSSSITAATGWRDHRDRLVQAVGCDTCEGKRYLFYGEVRTGGGPISVVRSPMPTRWLRADEHRRREEGGHDEP